MKYLLEVTELYRADTEEEAAQIIQEAKNAEEYDLIKYSSTHRERHTKDFDEEWYRVSLTKMFTSEKDPCALVNINYDRSGSNWEAHEQ